MFIYGIFPQLDIARSILIMNGLSIVPSILKFLIEFNISRNNIKVKEQNEIDVEEKILQKQQSFIDKICKKLKLKSSENLKRIIQFVLNLLSMLMQISIIPIVLTTSYLMTSNWYLPVALILVSLSSIRNYIEFVYFQTINTNNLNSNISFKQRFDLFLFKLSKNLRQTKINIDKSRHKIGLITNIWKISIFLLFAHIYNNKFKFGSILTIAEKASNNSNLSLNNSLVLNLSGQPLYYIYPFIVQLVSTVICYLGASLAFKLRMNRFCFALPMTLTTPISLIIALLICELNPNYVSIDQIKQHFVCSNQGYLTFFLRWHLIVGILVWWLSHLWTTSRIWLNYEYLFNFTTIKRVCFF